MSPCLSTNTASDRPDTEWRFAKMKRNGLCAACLLLAACIAPPAPADLSEVLLRDATGYPNMIYTNGNRSLGGFYAGILGWDITGYRMTIGEPTEITRIAGVGGDFEGYHSPVGINFYLNVYSAHDGLPREDAFAANPWFGNVVSDLSIGGASTSAPFGMSDENYPRYYITFDLEADNKYYFGADRTQESRSYAIDKGCRTDRFATHRREWRHFGYTMSRPDPTTLASGRGRAHGSLRDHDCCCANKSQPPRNRE
jgi:hypothetical protein